MLTLKYYGKTDFGKKRLINEDSFAIGPNGIFCAVADGMGGAPAGDIASSLFCETCSLIFEGAGTENLEDSLLRVHKAFTVANSRIFAHGMKNPGAGGLGCTAELLTFAQNSYVLGHIGDSRVYRLRDGRLFQLTIDHSFVQSQIEKGILREQQARTHSLRHMLLKALGVNMELDFDVIEGTLEKKDLFLLCSDGLSDMVEDSRMEEIFSKGMPHEISAEMLIESANESGGIDNITVVLISVEDL